MSMKEAFDIYFSKVDTEDMELPASDRINNGLFIPDTLSESGWAQWQPKLQTEPIDFEPLEKELGFSIHPHLKAYFSTYWFLEIHGEIIDEDGEEHFYDLEAVQPDVCVLWQIKQGHPSSSQTEFSQYMQRCGTFFYIGVAEGSTDCTLFFNNDSGEVICVDYSWASNYDFKKPLSEPGVSYKVADSLEELIKALEQPNPHF
ncbi:MAG: SecY-interacting protein Syd [Defluviitaleaceae bacterium]|nr:SecY-interacting protein Syd [Defluviitaleaceae bacterium]